MNASLKEKLESAFRGLHVGTPESDRVILTAEKDAVLSILGFLKGNGYDHLSLISCVDWIAENQFELVYILSGYIEQENTTIVLKTRISRESPEFSTATALLKNAEPYERELHELYGIRFKGHPRLTPLFLERDYQIPPFRKDFDTRRYVKDVFDKIPSVEDGTGNK